MTNQKTVLSGGQCVADLPYGFVYVVRGPSDKLLWELRDAPNLDIIHSISNEALVGIITAPASLNAGKHNYLVRYTNLLKLPDNLRPWLATRVFIWLPSFDGSLTAPQEKFYKYYTGGAFKQIDICSNTYEHNSLSSTIQEEDPILLPVLVDQYKHNPIKLNYLLSSKEAILNDTYIQDLLSFRNLLVALATPDPDYGIITKLASLPKTILNDYLVKPNLKHTKLWSLLKITKKYNTEAITCRDLWLYYEIFMSKLGKHYYNNPKYIVKLFFTWVYNSNSKWSDKSGKGFYKFSVGRNILFAFEPSKTAIKRFDEIFR